MAAIGCKAEVRADFSSIKIRTSAFPESGRSDLTKIAETTGRFRPEADVHNHSAGGARRATDPELAQDQATPVNRDEDVAPTRRVIDRHL